MYKRLSWILLLAALLLLSGCGRKGPLYLPKKPADAVASWSELAPGSGR